MPPILLIGDKSPIFFSREHALSTWIVWSLTQMKLSRIRFNRADQYLHILHQSCFYVKSLIAVKWQMGPIRKILRWPFPMKWSRWASILPAVCSPFRVCRNGNWRVSGVTAPPKWAQNISLESGATPLIRNTGAYIFFFPSKVWFLSRKWKFRSSDKETFRFIQ